MPKCTKETYKLEIRIHEASIVTLAFLPKLIFTNTLTSMVSRFLCMYGLYMLFQSHKAKNGIACSVISIPTTVTYTTAVELVCSTTGQYQLIGCNAMQKRV